MKKIALRSLLLPLFAAVALMGISCTSEEATEEVIGSMAVSGFVGLWICAAVVGGLIGLFFLVIWIIALVDCARRKPEEFPGGGENTKTIWLVILIVTFFITQLNGVAAIVYYFMVMKKMPRGKK